MFHRASAGYDVELSFIEGAGHDALRPGPEAFEVTVKQVLKAAHS